MSNTERFEGQIFYKGTGEIKEKRKSKNRCESPKSAMNQRDKASQTQYYVYDGRGSVSALTSVRGNVVVTYQYDAYGRAKVEGESYIPINTMQRQWITIQDCSTYEQDIIITIQEVS